MTVSFRNLTDNDLIVVHGLEYNRRSATVRPDGIIEVADWAASAYEQNGLWKRVSSVDSGCTGAEPKRSK